MTPRVLTKAQAAAYCGCTLKAFTSWVERGIVPGALRGTHRARTKQHSYNPRDTHEEPPENKSGKLLEKIRSRNLGES